MPLHGTAWHMLVEEKLILFCSRGTGTDNAFCAFLCEAGSSCVWIRMLSPSSSAWACCREQVVSVVIAHRKHSIAMSIATTDHAENSPDIKRGHSTRQLQLQQGFEKHTQHTHLWPKLWRARLCIRAYTSFALWMAPGLQAV